MKEVSEHEGHKISLDGRYKFVVSGPHFEGANDYQRAFDTYEKAVEVIDDRIRRAAKVKATNLDLEVLKHDGSGVVKIKGIHGRLGTLLFTDGAYSKAAGESYSGVHHVYPNVPWIAEALKEQADLERRGAAIRKMVEKFSISVSYARHSIRSAADIDSYVDDLKEEYAKKTADAKASASKWNAPRA